MVSFFTISFPAILEFQSNLCGLIYLSIKHAGYFHIQYDDKTIFLSQVNDISFFGIFETFGQIEDYNIYIAHFLYNNEYYHITIVNNLKARKFIKDML